MAGSVARIVVLALANGLQHAGREEADRVDAHRRLLDLALDLLIIPFHRFGDRRSEEHTSELQSLMRISYAVFCLKKKTQTTTHNYHHHSHSHRCTQNRTNEE